MRHYYTPNGAGIVSWRQASTTMAGSTRARRDFHRKLYTDGGYAHVQAVYGVVSIVAAQNITPFPFINTNAFYSPTVLGGAMLQPTPLINEHIFYSPSMQPGAVTVTPELLINTNAIFAHAMDFSFPTSTSPSLYRMNVPADAELQVLEKFVKQPADVQDYDVDYTEFLTAFADSPSSHTVVADGGVSLRYSVQVSGTIKVWLADGVDGFSYKVTVTLTTTGGRVRQTEFSLMVKEI